MTHKQCRLLFVLVLASLLLSTGCSPDAAVQKGYVDGKGTQDPAPPPQTSAARPKIAFSADTPDPATLGSITGTVNLSGLPSKPARLDMRLDPSCVSATPVYSENVIGQNGALGNVFLYIKSGPPAAMSVPTNVPPIVVDQKGCRFTPHIIAIPVGGWVEFYNSTRTTHTIHIASSADGNRHPDSVQGPNGPPQRMQFNQGELMVPVRSFGHPWMSAFINVSNTPYALTGADGRFTIANLPPGNYTIAAVHEKLGEQTATVVVAPHSTTNADFTFTSN